jgi:hypothetical protein
MGAGLRWVAGAAAAEQGTPWIESDADADAVPSQISSDPQPAALFLDGSTLLRARSLI